LYHHHPRASHGRRGKARENQVKHPSLQKPKTGALEMARHEGRATRHQLFKSKLGEINTS
jgi:hypothetical protein